MTQEKAKPSDRVISKSNIILHGLEEEKEEGEEERCPKDSRKGGGAAG